MAQKVPSAGGELLVGYLQLGPERKNRQHTSEPFRRYKTHEILIKFAKD